MLLTRANGGVYSKKSMDTLIINQKYTSVWAKQICFGLVLFLNNKGRSFIL